MFIPDPDFYPSRIPDLGSRIKKPQQKRGWKKWSYRFLYYQYKFHKILTYFILWKAEEKNLAQFSKIYRTFYPKKLSISSKNICLWSGIRDPAKNIFLIPDPGVKKPPDPDPQPVRNIVLTIFCFQEAFEGDTTGALTTNIWERQVQVRDFYVWCGPQHCLSPQGASFPTSQGIEEGLHLQWLSLLNF
jgi:hypothetical protein